MATFDFRCDKSRNDNLQVNGAESQARHRGHSSVTELNYSRKVFIAVEIMSTAKSVGSGAFKTLRSLNPNPEFAAPATPAPVTRAWTVGPG